MSDSDTQAWEPGKGAKVRKSQPDKRVLSDREWKGAKKTPTLKLISAVAADSWQPDKKSLKARKHDMWRKQAVDRGRVWLRLLIKDHPPSFCLFFSLLTSLKASWTSGQQRSSFFSRLCCRFIWWDWRIWTDPLHGRRRDLPTLFLGVSWSLCGNHWLHGWGKESCSQFKVTDDWLWCRSE